MNFRPLVEAIDPLISRRYPAPSLRLELQQVKPDESTIMFRRGLNIFRKTTFNFKPFEDLSPSEQSEVLGNANLLQLGLTICDWDDDGTECHALATVHQIKSERDLCARHHQMAVKQ